MERAAWFCPGCQKHHAPHVETCPAPADAISTTRLPADTFTVPYSPAPYPGWTLRGSQTKPCGCIGSCGNVACPNRPVIISGVATAGGLQ